MDLQDKEGLERMDHSFLEFEGGEMAAEEEKGEIQERKRGRKGRENQAEKGRKKKMRAKNPEEARKQGKGRDAKKRREDFVAAIFVFPFFFFLVGTKDSSRIKIGLVFF